MYIVRFQAKGSLNCESKIYGPFVFHDDAEEFLGSLPVAANCEYKFIDKLEEPTLKAVHEAKILVRIIEE